jgi:hypothetical protein
MRIRAFILLCVASLSCGTSIPPPKRPVKPEIHGWYAISIGEGLLRPSDPSGDRWDADFGPLLSIGFAVVGAVVTGGTMAPLLLGAVGMGASMLAGKARAPDPYAVLRIGDAEMQTPTVKDNPYAYWNLTMYVRLARSDDHMLSVDLFDHDLDDDDFAGSTSIDVADLVAAGKPVRLGPFDAVDAITVGAKFVADYDADPPSPGDLALPTDASVSLVLKRARVGGGKEPGAAIDHTLRRRMDRVRACYGDALKETPGLRGAMTVKLVVRSDGSIAKSRLKRDTVGSTGLAACITNLIKEWDFPPPAGRSVLVYGFVFDPGGGTLGRDDVRERFDETMDDEPDDASPVVGRGGSCARYSACVTGMARAYRDADFSGAKAAAKALTDSARGIADMKGAEADDACDSAMDAMRRAADAYKSIKGFKYPAACR